MSIIIKPMETAEERQGKGYVHWKSRHETYDSLIDPAYMEKHTLEKCQALAERWPDNLLVAKEDEAVVGFVGYGQCGDEDLTGAGEAFSIYVLAACHGQKVGYALMNAAFEKLSAHDRIAVWVLKGNDRAIRFYKRYGFRPDGAEKQIKLGTPRTELRMVYQK